MSNNIEEKVKQFLKQNPEPEDEQIHALAEKLDMDPDDLEEKIYKMLGKELNKGQKEVDAATKHPDKLGEGAKKRKKLKGQDKVHAVMKEFKQGTLHSGSGEKVTDRKQAIAIAMSEAGMSKSEVIYGLKRYEDLEKAKHKDQLKGGMADKNAPKDFDKKQLDMGIKIEMEHTDDPVKAKEIAMDHLKEIPDYYTRLKEMEDKADKEGMKKGGVGSGRHKEKYKASLEHLKQAAKVLKDLKETHKNDKEWPMMGTASHFLERIEEIISEDRGQAGLEPFINKEFKKSIDESLYYFVERISKGGLGSGRKPGPQDHKTLSGEPRSAEDVSSKLDKLKAARKTAKDKQQIEWLDNLIASEEKNYERKKNMTKSIEGEIEDMANTLEKSNRPHKYIRKEGEGKTAKYIYTDESGKEISRSHENIMTDLHNRHKFDDATSDAIDHDVDMLKTKIKENEDKIKELEQAYHEATEESKQEVHHKQYMDLRNENRTIHQKIAHLKMAQAGIDYAHKNIPAWDTDTRNSIGYQARLLHDKGKTDIKKSEGEITMINKLKAQIKELGPDGLKKAVPNLTDEQKEMIKSILEEMKNEATEALEKASITPQKATDKDAPAATVLKETINNTIIQEDKTGDDDDEKLVQAANATVNHQGDNSPEGIEGQVIKGRGPDKQPRKKKGEGFQLDPEKIKAAQQSHEDVKEMISDIKNKKINKSEEIESVEKAKKPKVEIEVKVEKEGEDKKDDKKEVEKACMKKSLVWEDENSRLNACTGGRNYHYSVNGMYDEALENMKKSEEDKSGDELQKSEPENKKIDINDIIEKSMDRSFKDIELENMSKALNEDPKSGKLVKSFSDEDLAATMGMDIEEVKKILGE